MTDTISPPPSGGHSSSSGPSEVKARPPRKPSVWDIYYPRKIEGHQDVIYVAAFPPIVFFWPTVLILFVCAFFQGVVGVSPSILGWLTVIVFSFNVVVLVQDFDQKKFLILVLMVLALILGVWILNLYGFSFLKSFANWILSFRPEISTDAYVLLGILMFVLFVWGLIVPLFDYWRLEQNEFVHYTQPIGKDMSIARLGCTIYKDIPDIFECILTFGGGDLVIRRDNQDLAVIHNVPFLGLRMDAIEHMLSETRVIVDKEV